MVLPKTQWANCFFFVCYALLRGRVACLAAVSSQSRWFPWHVVVLSPKGHALHFRAVLAHKENGTAPWWFLGRVEGVRRGELEPALRQSGRSLCWAIRSEAKIACLVGVAAAALFLPWIVGWSVWQIAWLLQGGIGALRSKRSRARTVEQQVPPELRLYAPDSAEFEEEAPGLAGPANLGGHDLAEAA